ncbi:type VI secretion system-associated protein TagF [Marinimicrobium alkaliphilum]|uniref:type VI secretion system-associated protein TagF n=1 Tax=Marinimicrobium alkaliphilum TaxID=2202654 RepID=UPI000DB97FF3|nr:type VI secretion system-associated protein TagF [Marinimicrobium alkaliphilum]
MSMATAAGFYGKLPAHGDFVYRGLPTACIHVWDEWLQALVGTAREQLGEHWLDVYLTSPIWHFVLSPGVLDEHVWAGVVLPSVDRVGRYFPFSIMTQLPGSAAPVGTLATNATWFEDVETLALQALDGQLRIDELADALAHTPIQAAFSELALSAPLTDPSVFPLDAYPLMLDRCLASQLPSYSVWSTQGSDRVDPCLASTGGLPPVARATAMLTGQWRDWQWQQLGAARIQG